MTEHTARSLRVPATLAALALLACTTPLLAGRPRIYALTGATVVPAPGQKIEGGTVVIRDGLIEAVGKDTKIPLDAVAIDARGMFVYPGLIDAGGWAVRKRQHGLTTRAHRAAKRR